MNWQIKYAIENLTGSVGLKAEVVQGDVIKIHGNRQQDVIATISAAYSIDLNMAKQCHEEEPKLDFLCGYRKECIWDGAAISYLSKNSIGWGNIGTLSSAALNGSANVAEHKDYFFSHRLIRQYPLVAGVERQFDRIFLITLKSGRSLRVAMVREYEPCGDAIRTIWDTFGPVDIAWNINPNGNPTNSARQAGAELGCEVIKWDEFKAYIRKG